jgi:peptidoglycan/xylan/chitin deacetylase (PgdA/CDA1 family)
MRKGRVKILAYHGVSAGPFYLNMFMHRDKFEAQIEFLCRKYRILGLHEAEEVIKRNQKLKEDVFVITLDDGYVDNYYNVFTIAKQYGISVTIYLTTECINQGWPTFVYWVILAVHNAQEKRIDLSARGLGIHALNSFEDREDAIRAIDRYAKALSYSERQTFLSEVLSLLGFERDDPLFQNRMLNWTQVVEMCREGIEFGAHSVTHPVLSGLPLREAETEICKSRDEIEKRISKRVGFFAYPYGGRDAINDQIVELVRRNAFTSGVVLFNSRHSPRGLYALGRMMISDEMTSGPLGRFSEAVFACEVSGLLDLLRRRTDRNHVSGITKIS